MLKHCLHIVFHAPKAKRLGGMDSEYSPVVWGFSMGAPCILTTQSLGKFRQKLGIFGYNWVLLECFAFRPKRVRLDRRSSWRFV